ncbi:hypothetical protein HYFRA_00006747 [Hymenoscyphus fraxineus]|uniref:Uncharacterized protein n=1 Tax=Hymenoscyphus fraxineus TaxID=746836 RepID=A0A9N9PI25_9HELO|nr:hypothetical protein HYFRA_00006747 [Hymenoscyphus fraxineus]
MTKRKPQPLNEATRRRFAEEQIRQVRQIQQELERLHDSIQSRAEQGRRTGASAERLDEDIQNLPSPGTYPRSPRLGIPLGFDRPGRARETSNHEYPRRRSQLTSMHSFELRGWQQIRGSCIWVPPNPNRSSRLSMVPSGILMDEASRREFEETMYRQDLQMIAQMESGIFRGFDRREEMGENQMAPRGPLAGRNPPITRNRCLFSTGIRAEESRGNEPPHGFDECPHLLSRNCPFGCNEVTRLGPVIRPDPVPTTSQGRPEPQAGPSQIPAGAISLRTIHQELANLTLDPPESSRVTRPPFPFEDEEDLYD